MARPYIAQGLDQQGQPEAAHAATDIYTDKGDGLHAARGLVFGFAVSLGMWIVIAVAVLVVMWL